MSRVADYANRVASGAERFPDMPTGAGQCARFARMLCERVGVSPYQIGDVYAVQRRNGHPVPYATDLEQGLREKGKAVTDLKPGDLVFNSNVSQPAGHVAIYLGNGLILHNSLYSGGRVVDGHVRVHPLSVFGAITTIARLDASNAPAEPAPPLAPATPAEPAPAPAPSPATAPFEWLGEATRAAFGNPATVGSGLGGDPLWVFKVLYPNEDRAPGYYETEEWGPVPGLIIVRQAEGTELEYAAPILGPLSLQLKDAAQKLRDMWTRLLAQHAEPARYGAVLEPLQRFVTDPKQFRWPLPGVEAIHLRLDASGDARGEVSLFIADELDAQAVHATLCMLQRYRNALVEVWLPHVYRDPRVKGPGGEKTVLEPVFVGMIEEVTAAPWPSNITFRVIPQTAAQGTRGMADEERPDGTVRPIRQHWEGQPIYRIIQDVAADHGLLVIGHSMVGLAGLPQLQRVLPVYDAMRRPPLDVLRELIEVSGGLRFKRLFGTELFGRDAAGRNLRAVYLVYDPAAWNPFNPEFWKSGLFTTLWRPLIRAVSGVEAAGAVTVFYPADLPEPDRLKRWVEMLRLYASPESRLSPLNDNGPVVNFANALLALSGNNALGEAYAAGKVETALGDLLDGLLPAEVGRVISHPVRVFDVEEMSSRNPGESEMSNPLIGSPTGHGPQRRPTASRVSVIDAAAQMGVKQGAGGQFTLNTPLGPQTFRGSDDVFLYYSLNESRPSMVMPGDASLDDSIRFYPYTLTLRCEAAHGLKIGMPACLIGFPRLDGFWEVASLEYDLSGDRQDVLVTLRTPRDIFAA